MVQYLARVFPCDFGTGVASSNKIKICLYNVFLQIQKVFSAFFTPCYPISN